MPLHGKLGSFWLALCLVLPCSPAAADPLVWVPPVQDTAASAPDMNLTVAMRRAAALSSPRGWPWRQGQPDHRRCDAGCKVIRIKGSASPAPAYTLRRVDLPLGPGARTRLSLPAHTPTQQVAEARVVKSSFLLADVDPPPRPWRPPPPRVVREMPPPEAPPRHWLSLGPAMTLGLDSAYFTFGVEVGGTFGLAGPFALRAAVGYQTVGTGGGPRGDVEYSALPVHLMLGAWFAGSRWSAGAFGGLTITALWLELDNDTMPSTSEVAVGIGFEGRAALRLVSSLWLGASLRAGILPGEVDVTVDEELLYLMPNATLSLALDLSWSF